MLLPVDDAGSLEKLDRDECIRLLGTQSVGRIAVARPRESPLVVPVNYVVDDDFLQFRSGYGTKLRALIAGPVSFEVDWSDATARIGWSVLVRGRAEEIRQRDARPPLPEPWVPADKPYLIRIWFQAITGRRILRAAAG